MPRHLTRGSFLAAGAAAALFPARTALAAVLPEGDLAYLRLLVGVELLTLDFAAKHKGFTRLHADDTAHYHGLASLLASSGVTAATAGDVDFSYPKGTTMSKLKTLSVGAYAGALENVQSTSVRLPLAQILVNESRQLAVLEGGFGHAFGPALSIAAVSSALDEYES